MAPLVLDRRSFARREGFLGTWHSATVVTPAVLLWTYRARRPAYRKVRNALVAASAIGLVGFTPLPMAPPRMLPSYVDTLATTSANGWWEATPARRRVWAS